MDDTRPSVTLEQFVGMIPDDERTDIELDINRLLSEGWGELTITVVRHKVNGHIVSISKVYNRDKEC